MRHFAIAVSLLLLVASAGMAQEPTRHTVYPIAMSRTILRVRSTATSTQSIPQRRTGLQAVQIELQPGSNKLQLSIEGVTSSDRTARDNDTLTFLVQ